LKSGERDPERLAPGEDRPPRQPGLEGLDDSCARTAHARRARGTPTPRRGSARTVDRPHRSNADPMPPARLPPRGIAARSVAIRKPRRASADSLMGSFNASGASTSRRAPASPRPLLARCARIAIDSGQRQLEGGEGRSARSSHAGSPDTGVRRPSWRRDSRQVSTSNPAFRF